MVKNYVVHDISLTLVEGMVAYPKDVPYQRRLQRDQAQGDSSSVSQIETTVHVGTHIDAPNHFIQNGYGADQIPLDHLFGPVSVADCTGISAVTALGTRSGGGCGQSPSTRSPTTGTAARDFPRPVAAAARSSGLRTCRMASPKNATSHRYRKRRAACTSAPWNSSRTTSSSGPGRHFGEW